MKSLIQKFGWVGLTIILTATGAFSQERSEPNPDERGTLEMVFVVDTTGSMSGLIEGAKQRIWGIVNEVMQRESRPRVRVGLVAYRDLGDDYVTRVEPITEDLDKIYTTLMDYQASGGGDEPENVRRALAEGVSKVGWSKSRIGLAQIIFLVGDAPPQNYEQEPDVIETTALAVKENIFINTIQCGSTAKTKEIWQQIARRGEGKYFSIAQDGGVQAIGTPYDEKLAELAQTISRTYITYGAVAVQSQNFALITRNETTIAADAPMTAQAERAVNKAVNSFSYAGDLLEDIINERVDLKDIKVEELPEELRNLTPEEREKEIGSRIDERRQIRREILELSKQRDAYIAAERRKIGAQNGFDTAVAEALNEQLRRRGIK